ncbi:MAG: hypothetical protein PF961_19310, partial [Planctomycetota bacterium]|nr:hypothetical protein [Planctomycetota bacterium]
MEDVEIDGRRLKARYGGLELLPQAVTDSALGLSQPREYGGPRRLGIVGDSECALAVIRMAFDGKSWPALHQEWNSVSELNLLHAKSGNSKSRWFVDVVLERAFSRIGLPLGLRSNACPGVRWVKVGAILHALMAGLLADERARGFSFDCLAAIRGGYVPLGWLGGSWPDGYLAVGCPHGPGALPKHLLVDERQVMADARGVEHSLGERIADMERQKLAQPGFIIEPMQVDTPRITTALAIAALQTLAEGMDPLLRNQWVGLLQDATSQVGPGAEGVTLRWASGWSLTLAPGWGGAIAGLPADLAQLVRSINGMVLSKPRGVDAQDVVFASYDGRDFQINWRLWAPGPHGTTESLLNWHPLAPIQCPDEIYIYDPRASGAVSFHRVDHEVGDPGPALP